MPDATVAPPPPQDPHAGEEHHEEVPQDHHEVRAAAIALHPCLVSAPSARRAVCCARVRVRARARARDERGMPDATVAPPPSQDPHAGEHHDDLGTVHESPADQHH